MGFLWANFSLVMGAAWLALDLIVEAFIWIAATRRLEDEASGAYARRANYLLGCALGTANWSGASVIYWLSGQHGLQIVAIVVITGQLVHAQAFAYRSKMLLAVMAGIPAATLLTLPFVHGELHGRALASVLFAMVVMLSYVGASAFANIKASRELTVAYREVQSLAYFDALTALANRRMFDERFSTLLAHSAHRQANFALLLVDLDGLKQVNDSLGHDAGDAILIDAAGRLRALIGETDSLARVGGDEFAILVADVDEPADVEPLCCRIIEAFRPAFQFRGATLKSTTSVGVAMFPDHGEDRDAVYKAADLALYAAKRSGRNTWRFYSAELAA